MASNILSNSYMFKGLSSRAITTLSRLGNVNVPTDLANVDYNELIAVRGCGVETTREILDFAHYFGLKMRNEPNSNAEKVTWQERFYEYIIKSARVRRNMLAYKAYNNRTRDLINKRIDFIMEPDRVFNKKDISFVKRCFSAGFDINDYIDEKCPTVDRVHLSEEEIKEFYSQRNKIYNQKSRVYSSIDFHRTMLAKFLVDGDKKALLRYLFFWTNLSNKVKKILYDNKLFVVDEFKYATLARLKSIEGLSEKDIKTILDIVHSYNIGLADEDSAAQHYSKNVDKLLSNPETIFRELPSQVKAVLSNIKGVSNLPQDLEKIDWITLEKTPGCSDAMAFTILNYAHYHNIHLKDEPYDRFYYPAIKIVKPSEYSWREIFYLKTVFGDEGGVILRKTYPIVRERLSYILTPNRFYRDERSLSIVARVFSPELWKINSQASYNLVPKLKTREDCKTESETILYDTICRVQKHINKYQDVLRKFLLTGDKSEFDSYLAFRVELSDTTKGVLSRNNIRTVSDLRSVNVKKLQSFVYRDKVIVPEIVNFANNVLGYHFEDEDLLNKK